jgi:hypothetical protein
MLMEFPNSVDGHTMRMLGWNWMANFTRVMAMFFANSSWHQRNQINIYSLALKL